MTLHSSKSLSVTAVCAVLCTALFVCFVASCLARRWEEQAAKREFVLTCNEGDGVDGGLEVWDGGLDGGDETPVVAVPGDIETEDNRTYGTV